MKIQFSNDSKRLLDALARHGLFGESREEVVKRLVDEKLREIVLQGWMGTPGIPSGETQPLFEIDPKIR